MWKQHAIWIAAAMELLAQPGAAVAQMSANNVMPGCQELANETSKNLVSQGYCRGVIQGLLSFGGLVGICRPNQVSNAQAARVIVLYIDQRPARMHEDFTDLALEALQQAWPCRR
jgi:Rap1a immunity proteins